MVEGLFYILEYLIMLDDDDDYGDDGIDGIDEEDVLQL